MIRLYHSMLYINQKEQEKKRHSKEHFAWRNAVLDRDNYKCRRCNSTEHLEVHHIQPYNIFIDKQFDIDNGITMCYPCHKEATKLINTRYIRNHKYRRHKDVVLINEEYPDNQYIKELDKSIE